MTMAEYLTMLLVMHGRETWVVDADEYRNGERTTWQQILMGNAVGAGYIAKQLDYASYILEFRITDKGLEYLNDR